MNTYLYTTDMLAIITQPRRHLSVHDTTMSVVIHLSLSSSVVYNPRDDPMNALPIQRRPKLAPFSFFPLPINILENLPHSSQLSCRRCGWCWFRFAIRAFLLDRLSFRRHTFVFAGGIICLERLLVQSSEQILIAIGKALGWLLG